MERASNTDDPKLTIVYDGDCPFCTRFVQLMALKRTVGSVDLVDARSANPVVEELLRAGVDLNEGMAVIFGEKTYFGADAVALIAGLSNRRSFPGRLLSRLLSNPKRAKLLYPAMKCGRRIVLSALRRRPISGPET